MKLAPEAVAARKKLARRDQRIETRREQSGNASLSGRELDTADVMASKAYIDVIAVKLRNSGPSGTLGRCAPSPSPTSPRAATRSTAFTPATRHPAARIRPQAIRQPPTRSGQRGTPAARARPKPPGRTARPRPQTQRWPRIPDPAQAPHPAASAPVPALVNLLVPLGTYLGWSTAPAQARMGTARRRRDPRHHPRRRPPPQNPLVRDNRRPAGHRHRARLRPRPAPLDRRPARRQHAPRQPRPPTAGSRRPATRRHSTCRTARPSTAAGQHQLAALFAASTSPSGPSPKAAATTRAPRASTCQAAPSATWPAPAPRPAPHPAASPRPSTATSTTPRLTRLAPHASATSHPNADGTTGASRHPDGR